MDNNIESADFNTRDSWTYPSPGTRYFTFAIYYPRWDAWEEIDIHAAHSTEALAKARVVASKDYEAGWTKIEQMQAGGSGGLVTIL